MAQLWNELLKTAILGTDRKPLALPPPEDALGAFVAQLFADDPAWQLLSTAATIDLATRAATTGVSVLPMPPTCPEDPEPAASSVAAVLLAKLLDVQPLLVPEFCETCARVHRRLPAELLPRLLAYARKERVARRAVDPVLGVRGHWLAHQNPDWDFAVGQVEPGPVALDASVWQTGTREQRLRLLAEQRARDPESSRQLVASSWEQEDHAMRAEIVQGFAAQLEPADEPLLEACLDDRRKGVRTAAQGLLARLPQSAFAQRMLERAMACLRFTAKKAGLMSRLVGGKGTLTLEVELPAACDKAMARDGIAAKVPAHLKFGERSWWFRQILSSVSPSALAAAVGIPAEQMEQVALASDFSKEITESWHEAAKRCHDADWAFRLHQRSAERYQDLLPILRPEQREQAVLSSVTAARPADVTDVAQQLLAFEDTIPLGIARAAATLLRQAIRRKPKNVLPWGLPWEQLAMRLPVEIAAEVLAEWPDAGGDAEPWGKHAGKFQEVLQLRHEIRQALAG